MAFVGRASIRSITKNRPLARMLAGYALAGTAEWAMWIAVLVYSFERDGAGTAGFAAVALLVPAAAVAPFAGHAADGRRPERVLVAAHAVQAIALGAAAVLAVAGAPAVGVIAATGVAITGVTFVRPSVSVLVPGLVVAPRDLVTANLVLGNADSTSVLIGPLLAGALLSLDGAALVFAVCAVSCGSAAALVHMRDASSPPRATSAKGSSDRSSIAAIVTTARELARRPGAVPLLGVLGAQYALVGALDLLLVNLALGDLHLGDAGSGLLSASFGVGAVAGGVVSAIIVGRRALAVMMTVTLAAIAASMAVLGLWTTLVVALVVLPVAGLSRSLLDVSGRMLLQRCAPADAVASVFAILEALAGVGTLSGSVLVQVLVAGAGVRVAVGGVAVFFLLLCLSTASGLRRADQHADAPVVEVRLLRTVELLAPLPGPVLESLARDSITVHVEPGVAVISEGEIGDRYYVIADGSADVFVGDIWVRTMRRGRGFGEIALLADVPRTATVVAATPLTLLALERSRFLSSVIGHDASARVAWAVARSLHPPLSTVEGG